MRVLCFNLMYYVIVAKNRIRALVFFTFKFFGGMYPKLSTLEIKVMMEGWGRGKWSGREGAFVNLMNLEVMN